MDQQHSFEATTEGQRAGRLRLPASLNPYPANDPRHAEWLRMWRQALASNLLRMAA